MRFLPFVLLLACGPSDDDPSPPKDEADADTDADADSDTDADTDADADTDTDADADADWAPVHDVFLANCTPCHVDVLTPSADLPLDEPTDIVGVVDPETGLAYIEPGSLELSYLWHKVEGTHLGVGGDGQRMPITSVMPQPDKDVLSAWILAGAPFDGGGTTGGTTGLHADNPLCDPVQALCEGPGCPEGPATVAHAPWHNRLTESPTITWDPVPGAVSYEVAIGEVPGRDDAYCFTPTTETEHTFGAIWVLEDGVTYHASVRAFFADGTVSEATASDGWTVDIQPPAAPVEVDDGAVPVDGHIVFEHDSSDVGAGFDHYEIAIGTAPFGDDELPWTPVGTDPEAWLDDHGGLGQLVPLAWHWLSVRAVDAADNTSQPGTSKGFITCPDDYVFVPGDDALGTTPFCAATYEMRPDGLSDGDGLGFTTAYLPESRPTGLPWSSLGNSDARVLCDNLGFSYQLMSNMQWQTIGRSIERTAANWSGGAVGTGLVNRGHCDEDPLAPLDADGNPCVGTNNPTCEDPAGVDWHQKRTHWLDNGAVIWDFSGNLQERLDGSTGAHDGLWTDFDSSAFTVDPGWEDLRHAFAPAGPYTYVEGMGRGYGGTINLTRGGSFDPAPSGSAGSRNDEDVGIFSFHHNSWNTSDKDGFRCIFVPM